MLGKEAQVLGNIGGHFQIIMLDSQHLFDINESHVGVSIRCCCENSVFTDLTLENDVNNWSADFLFLFKRN